MLTRTDLHEIDEVIFARERQAELVERQALKPLDDIIQRQHHSIQLAMDAVHRGNMDDARRILERAL